MPTLPRLEDVTLEDLPPTQFELDQHRHALVGLQNEARERRRVVKANRAAGHPAPRVGDKLYVSIGDRTLMRRSRAGLRFEGKGQRKTVEVVDATDEEIKVMQAEPNSQDVVNVWGAEQILADEALSINQRAIAPEELDEVRRRNDALEEENRTMREENRKLREARQGAKDEGDGAPARLIAQREAKAKLEAEGKIKPKTTDDVGFGKDPEKK